MEGNREGPRAVSSLDGQRVRTEGWKGASWLCRGSQSTVPWEAAPVPGGQENTP